MKYFVCMLIMFFAVVSCVKADTYVLNEYFDDDQTLFTDHAWVAGISNYSEPGWTYAYDQDGHNFAVTDLYFGSINPRTDSPNSVQVNLSKSLPYLDSTFSLSYQFAWSGSQNTDGFFQHVYLITSSGNVYGAGATDMWHWAKGSVYLYANNGNPEDMVQTYTGHSTLSDFSGTGTVTISRNESDEISVSVNAGGASLSVSSIVDDSDIKAVRLVYGGYNPNYYSMTLPTMYSDSLLLQGESSSFNAVPEPLSVVLLGLCSGYLLGFRKKRS